MHKVIRSRAEMDNLQYPGPCPPFKWSLSPRKGESTNGEAVSLENDGVVRVREKAYAET